MQKCFLIRIYAEKYFSVPFYDEEMLLFTMFALRELFLFLTFFLNILCNISVASALPLQAFCLWFNRKEIFQKVIWKFMLLMQRSMHQKVNTHRCILDNFNHIYFIAKICDLNCVPSWDMNSMLLPSSFL